MLTIVPYFFLSKYTLTISSSNPPPVNPPPAGVGPAAGTTGEVRYRGGKRFSVGMIKHLHHDGSFDIMYDDGKNCENRVSPSMVRRVSLESPTDQQHTSSLAGTALLSACKKVEVRYRGGKRFFPGTISKVNSDGTYDIEYDDGDGESSVGASLIRKMYVNPFISTPISHRRLSTQDSPSGRSTRRLSKQDSVIEEGNSN